MDHLVVNIATWMLIVEAALVVLFVLINYSIRIYHYFLLKERLTVNDKIKSIFFKYVKSGADINLQDMTYFKKHMLDVFKNMEEYDVSTELKAAWVKLREQLIMRIFYPRGKVLSRSWRPYRRYYAARCFMVHYEEIDAPMVIKLIEDPILLVALNASRVAFKYHCPLLVNASIDVFSKYRKIRQSIYATIAAEWPEHIEKIVVDRLMIEKDPYVKAFCYRLLQQLPIQETFDDMIKDDLASDVLDLRIAALHYSGYNPAYNHFLGKYIDDEQWQVRAIAAEWIGRAQYLKALPALGKRLSDHEWWVRIRTAEALGKCGEAGIAYLKMQSEAKDKYAYDAARQVLDTIEDGAL